MKKQNGGEVQQNYGSQVKDSQSLQNLSQFSQDQVQAQHYSASNQYGNLNQPAQQQQTSSQLPPHPLPQTQQTQFPQTINQQQYFQNPTNLKAPIAQHPQQPNNFGVQSPQYPQTGLQVRTF
jgi:hypothetical protein